LATLTPIRVTEQAQQLAGAKLQAGDIALDGTAGKGRDTVYLAQHVGPTGHVHSFDIQDAALKATQNLLHLAGLEAQVSLHHRSHAEITEALPVAHRGQLSAAIFNLGYLPGGHEEIITQPDSTVTALQATYDNLRPGGRLIVVIYTGHEGGKEEAAAVLKFAEQGQQEGARVEQLGKNDFSVKPWILVIDRPA
jgi:predicted methyltransferase